MKKKHKQKGHQTPPTMTANIPPATNPAPAPALPNEKAQLDELLNRFQAHRGKPNIVYWTSNAAKIAWGVDISLYDQMKALGPVEDLDLIVCTNGGDTEAPGRIVSLTREFAKRFSLLVPHRCFSAGTMIAMGANEIVMTPLSVLGPIDPSRTHPLLPRREGAENPEPISVQDMRHAMQFIRETGATPGAQLTYTPEAMAQIFSSLFDKIHPLAIGAIEQSYALAKLVGKRCLESHMDPETESERIKKIVDTLCDEYKSHGYQIGRREARQLGLKVVDADATTESQLIEVFKFYNRRQVFVQQPPHKPGSIVNAHIAWLDSPRAKFRIEAQYQAGQNNQLQFVGDQWKPY